MTAREPLGEARCREILEVGPEATQEDIRRAYIFLRGLYAPDSPALAAPSMDEFDPLVVARILAEVEAAYAELCERQEAALPAPLPVRTVVSEPDHALDGPSMRALREAGGFTLERLASETSIRLAYLEALEEERFRDLPSAPVIVRGYLTAYLAALGVGGEATITGYVHRFQMWQGKAPTS